MSKLRKQKITLNSKRSKLISAELKQAPPYSCKLLVPTKGKEIIENEKSDKFPKKVYTFDVTKYDEIFDLLVKDGQLIVPSNVKLPPLDQRKKRGFCKYHSFLGHKTSQCFLFRDLIQNAIKDGRLRFADKPKMKVDDDPLDVADTNYSEPVYMGEINMVEANEGDTPSEEKNIEDENHVLAEVEKEVTKEVAEDVHKEQEASIEVVPLAASKEIQATEGQENRKQELTQATEGLRLKLEKVQITTPVLPQKEIWDTLGEPNGKFDYLVKYSAPESSKIPIEDVKPTGWGDDDIKGEDVDVNMVDMERPRSEIEEMERYLEKEKYKMEESYARDASLKDYLMLCHKGNAEMILCPRCSIICNQRIAADFEKKQRARTGINWRQDNQLFRCYPKVGESLLEFLVRYHKGATKCLVCPRCSAVYDQSVAGAFETIPFAPCWNHKEVGQMSQHFKGNYTQRKPDSPYPKGARRVTFKIPAEVPSDKWLQVKTNKGKDKWRGNDRNGRHAMVCRRQFNTAQREELRLENYKGNNPMSRSQWRRQQRVRKAEREALADKGAVSTSNKEVSSTNKPTTSKQPENKPPVSRRLFSETKPDESKEYTPSTEEDEDMCHT